MLFFDVREKTYWSAVTIVELLDEASAVHVEETGLVVCDKRVSHIA